MKMIKLLVSTALVATSFSPLAVSPAYATILPSSATEATEANQCAADLGANAGTLLHSSSHAFTTEVLETGQVDGTPTEVPNTRLETAGSRFGTGSATFSVLSIVGNPFRTGGSVNMFGLQGAKYKNWSNSEYDFTADFATVTTISYTCEVTEHTEIYVPAVLGHPVEGYYTNSGTHPSNGQGSCQGIPNTNPNWGHDIGGNPNTGEGGCDWHETAPAVDSSSETWNPGPDVDRTDLDTFHTVNETNNATGNGHEANAGPWSQQALAGTLWNAAQVVICISPKRLPGTWTQQNGYTGTKCTTAYFNTAPWGGGSQTSNGTYISVPAI